MASMLVVTGEIEKLTKKDRVFRSRTSQLDTLSNDELVNRYRMPRHSILELLDMVRPLIDHPTKRSRALSCETQLLLTTRFLSKGGFLMEMGNLHGIHESTVSRSFHRTISALNQVLDNIHFKPENAHQRMQEFYQLSNFPKVIGAIDGTLIPIKRPNIDVEAAYVCRKGYHAINVQAVCDANLRFINVVSKWPGPCHDSSMFASSQLSQYLETSPQTGWLLGDSGYACRPWLLTPLRDPNTKAEQRHNSAHCKTRNTVERAFGVLKSRFKCLHKSSVYLQFSPRKCSAIIMATFKLHNFCVASNLPHPPLLGDEHEHVEVDQPKVDDGFITKRELMNKKFS